ncbi:hypothetical protein ATG_17450 [Desulfurococcaceae archaeon AG1]|nr:hypothetical protein ATG_17450 [Desulfurococcaceae archaeon AG1]
MENILASIQSQYEIMNQILKQYGIELSLYAVKLHSEECDTCVEYITLVRFKDRYIYEEFVKKLKQQIQGGYDSGEERD